MQRDGEEANLALGLNGSSFGSKANSTSNGSFFCAPVPPGRVIRGRIGFLTFFSPDCSRAEEDIAFSSAGVSVSGFPFASIFTSFFMMDFGCVVLEAGRPGGAACSRSPSLSKKSRLYPFLGRAASSSADGVADGMFSLVDNSSLT